MNSRRFARTLILALSLSACVENIEVAEVVETTNVIFSPSTGTIPLPNDLLFLGSTDLTLNLPAPADPVQQGLFDAVNALDGWSTTSPLSISFDGPIEGNLVNLMSSVHLFEVLTLGQLDPADQYPPVGTPVVGVTQQLTPGLDYMPAPLSDDPSNDTIVVLPLAPLKAGSSYMLVITNGMNDADGEAVSFGPEYELARHTTPYPSDHPLYGLQILVNAMEAVAVSDGGLDRDDIVLTLTFTTQSIGSRTRLSGRGLPMARSWNYQPWSQELRRRRPWWPGWNRSWPIPRCGREMLSRVGSYRGCLKTQGQSWTRSSVAGRP